MQASALDERRTRLRDALIDAAERRIAAAGVGSLKARDLASEVGCALGAIYNVFPDLDAVIVAVKSRTLVAIDTEMSEAGQREGLKPDECLLELGRAYLRYAIRLPRLWRALFEHSLPEGYAIPDWYYEQLVDLFRHLHEPLAGLFPERDEPARAEMAQALFAAVHGVVALGLDGKLGAVTAEVITRRIEFLIGSALRGA